MIKAFCVFLLFLVAGSTFAQPDRWQQRVKYTMNIDMDVTTNQFTGRQKLEYTNNSPDQLTRVFYHLYYNAFQPNSSMDVRSREYGKQVINGRRDWDPRVTDRISKLKPEEIGYQKIISLKMNGVPQPFKYHENFLSVLTIEPNSIINHRYFIEAGFAIFADKLAKFSHFHFFSFNMYLGCYSIFSELKSITK